MSAIISLHESQKSSNFSENWSKNEQAYTGDELIDAFIQGKEAGRNETLRILLSQFVENIKEATSLAEKLYNQASERGVLAKAIHLKAEDITKFKALLIVDQNDFLSDEFRDLYVLARFLKTDSETENFYIEFSFLPYSEKLNEECLSADGYFFKYEKKS